MESVMAILELGWTLATLFVAGIPSVMTTTEGPRIIVGTSDSCIVSLAGDGSEVWRRPVGGRVSVWPAIDEVPGLGVSILGATDDGDVLCLSPSGTVRWRTHLEDDFSSFNNVSVLRGATDVSIVTSGRRGTVHGLTANGDVVWRYQTSTNSDHSWGTNGVGPVAVGDIDSDGRDEVFFTSADGHVYCVDSDGEFRWNVYVGSNSQWSGPVVADLGSGPCLIVGGTDDQLRCISPEGEVLWTQRGTGAGYIEVGISIGDLNRDGQKEIVFVHQGRALQVADSQGEMLWSTLDYTGGDQPFGPSIGDIDGDGLPEFLLSQRKSTAFYVVDTDGSLLEKHDISGGMIGAPVIADVDDDGLLEVLVVSQRDRVLSCYNTTAPAGPNSVQWATSRGDFDGRANRLVPAEHTTSPSPKRVGDAAIRRVSPQSLRLGTNAIVYVPDSPQMVNTTIVEISVVGVDGTVTRAVTDPEDRLQFDLEILETGDYIISAVLVDTTTGDRLGKLVEQITIEQFEEERKEVEHLLTELAGVVGQDGNPSRDAAQVHRSSRLRWMGIEEQIDSYESMSADDRRQLVHDVETAISMLRREIVIQDTHISTVNRLDKPVEFLPWQLEHPWMEFEPVSDRPPESLLTDIQIRTDGRGHDALAVQIANVYARPLDVRVWLEPLEDGSGRVLDVSNHLELRQVTWVPVPKGSGTAADALPELGNAGIVRLAASSSERLWIDVLTKDLPPGEYTTTLHMRALTQAGATWDVPIHWTVEPTALPDVMPLKFCNWSHGYRTHFAHAQGAAMADMHDHHTSVFTGTPTIRVTYDAEGNLVDNTGWDEQDEFLSKMRPQNILLYHGLRLSPTEGALGEFSDAWKKAYATFLPQWVEHLRQLGFGYERWAFYPVDEPGLRGGVLIDKLERIARFTKGLDSNVRFYTDPFRGMTVEDHRRLADVLDIVQPALYGVVLSENTDRIDFIKTTDQVHWIYEPRARVKEEITPAYYWEMIWTASEIGFTGIGYWTYCTTRYDLWEAAADWVLVYQGAKGPVPSRRWQAVRIGIEDYARLARLRDAIGSARDAGRIDAADRAEQRLDEIVTEAKATRWDPGVVARIRREVIDLTLKLQQ
jgi:hypothetical protein